MVGPDEVHVSVFYRKMEEGRSSETPETSRVNRPGFLLRFSRVGKLVNKVVEGPPR